MTKSDVAKNRTTAANSERRRNASGEVSRQRILDATARLMAERGYAGTSMSAITAATGLPTSSIHHHFGSKEGLLLAIFERRIEWIRHERDIDLDNGTAAELVGTIVRHTFEDLDVKSANQRLIVSVSMEMKRIKPELCERMQVLRAEAAATFAQIFARIYRSHGPALSRRIGAALAEFLLIALQGIDINNEIEKVGARDLKRLTQHCTLALLGIADGLIAGQSAQS